LASENEKLKELLDRLKKLTEKQALIEEKIREFEATVKPKEPEE
jgi:hypothetical protein